MMHIDRIAHSPELNITIYGAKLLWFTFNIIKHNKKIKVSII